MEKAIEHIKQKRGFTVIEAFVGITILLVGIVGPLALVNTNLQGARFSRDQITAVYLAQDAIETVRQMRDNNFLDDNDWLNGLGACTSGYCTVDGVSGTVSNASGSCDVNSPNNDFRLEVNHNSGTYGHNISGGEDSRFWRCVEIDESSSRGITDARITATVIFDTGGYYQAYETVGYISDWYPTN